MSHLHHDGHCRLFVLINAFLLKNNKKKDDRPQSSAPRKKSTLEIIAELGQEKKVKKKAIRLKKADYDFALEKDPKTLVARWHKQFHSTKQKLDDELLQNLVLREKDKYEVLRSKVLRNNAVYIVGLPGERKYAPSRSRKSTRYSSQEDRSNSMGGASDSRSFIGVGDTCYYESPTGIEELVTVAATAEEDEIKAFLSTKALTFRISLTFACVCVLSGN